MWHVSITVPDLGQSFQKKKKHLFSLSLLFLISISKDYVVIMLVE